MSRSVHSNRKIHGIKINYTQTHLNLLMIQETQEVEGCKVDALPSIYYNVVARRSAKGNEHQHLYVCGRISNTAPTETINDT